MCLGQVLSRCGVEEAVTRPRKKRALGEERRRLPERYARDINMLQSFREDLPIFRCSFAVESEEGSFVDVWTKGYPDILYPSVGSPQGPF
jgi:hypothetical protein